MSMVDASVGADGEEYHEDVLMDEENIVQGSGYTTSGQKTRNAPTAKQAVKQNKESARAKGEQKATDGSKPKVLPKTKPKPKLIRLKNMMSRDNVRVKPNNTTYDEEQGSGEPKEEGATIGVSRPGDDRCIPCSEGRISSEWRRLPVVNIIAYNWSPSPFPPSVAPVLVVAYISRISPILRD
ncbi:hypothetical protein Cgig2_009504 [Carnegiea gigantea]|uniref:Uncharacterized protein n=1 Tax=Carnegiea gigantea TaxID=171969 RepID=A0A9Q1GNQ0_9CARY|nr:hypothetical protein Cgig2_009504 [Carnegiea gigantea]